VQTNLLKEPNLVCCWLSWYIRETVCRTV